MSASFLLMATILILLIPKSAPNPATNFKLSFSFLNPALSKPLNYQQRAQSDSNSLEEDTPTGSDLDLVTQDPSMIPSEGKELTLTCILEEFCTKCQEDEEFRREIKCQGSCLYTVELVEELGIVGEKSRGCAIDEEGDGNIVEGQECYKLEIRNKTYGHCVCFQDKCNHPNKDEGFDSKLKSLSVDDPPSGSDDVKKSKLVDSGATSNLGTFCGLFAMFWIGVYCIF